MQNEVKPFHVYNVLSSFSCIRLYLNNISVFKCPPCPPCKSSGITSCFFSTLLHLPLLLKMTLILFLPSGLLLFHPFSLSFEPLPLSCSSVFNSLVLFSLSLVSVSSEHLNLCMEGAHLHDGQMKNL